MSNKNLRFRALVTLFVVGSLVASCGLPRSAPTKREIMRGSIESGGDSHFVTVDDRIAKVTDVVPELGFSAGFQNAGVLAADTIQPGDTLGIRIWENVDKGILTERGGTEGGLGQLQVDSKGYIYVPYAGRIKAAGNTPEGLRRVIADKLAEQTPNPEVILSRAPGDGAVVTIAGDAGISGVFPIERSTATLAGMMAQAGSAGLDPESTQIVVTRNGKSGRIWYKDLFTDPGADIALRDGDRILIEGDSRQFTSLGATGQSVVEFKTRTISVIEALSMMGGLNGSTADPKGIFIFRDEPEDIAREVLQDPALIGDQRIVYMMDLTKPSGIFMAREFGIHDGDTVLVTEAPFAQWQKTVGAILGTANSVTALGNIADAASP